MSCSESKVTFICIKKINWFSGPYLSWIPGGAYSGLADRYECLTQSTTSAIKNIDDWVPIRLIKRRMRGKRADQYAILMTLDRVVGEKKLKIRQSFVCQLCSLEVNNFEFQDFIGTYALWLHSRVVRCSKLIQHYGQIAVGTDSS